MVVAEAEFHTCFQRAHDEPTEFTATHHAGLAEAALGSAERIPLRLVLVGHSFVGVEDFGLRILEPLDLEKPTFALRGPPALVGSGRIANHHSLVALLDTTLLIERKLGDVWDYHRQHLHYPVPLSQAFQLRHPALIRPVSSAAHIIKHREPEIRLARLASHMPTRLAECGSRHDKLAIHAVGQIRLDPLPDKPVAHRLERARQRLSTNLQATNAIKLGRGQHRKSQFLGLLAFTGEHRLRNRTHRLLSSFQNFGALGAEPRVHRFRHSQRATTTATLPAVAHPNDFGKIRFPRQPPQKPIDRPRARGSRSNR